MKGTSMEFVNQSELEFSDISSEECRQYAFASGLTVRIEAPMRLNVSANGHRLFDASGVSHYVDLAGRFHLQWKVKEGQPNFVR